jgi:hypothetical protein
VDEASSPFRHQPKARDLNFCNSPIACPTPLALDASRSLWSLRSPLTMLRATSRLLACRITFFTRTPCGLCDNAKAVVHSVRAKRPLEYHEINVMEQGQEKWKGLYEFDTPVVSRPGLPLSLYIHRYRVPKCSTRSTSTRPELKKLRPHRSNLCIASRKKT